MGVAEAGCDSMHRVGVAMYQPLQQCVLAAVLLLSPLIRLSAEPIAESPAAPATDAVDIEALIIRAEAMLAFIREHHIDPPSDGDMWLEGTHGLVQGTVPEQYDLDFRVQSRSAQLSTAAERHEFLLKTWSRKIASNIPSRAKSRYNLLRIFVQRMLPEGADLVPANEYKIEERTRGNRYSGTGIVLNSSDPSGFLRIDSVVPGGPMERAGGHVGHLIVNIDGRDTHDWTMSQIRDVLSGDEGTSVTVELKPGVNAAGRTIVVTRGTILVPALAGMVGSHDNFRVQYNSPIRYVAVRTINGSTVHDLRRLESTFRAEGARAVVLDLRRTGGHDLHTALLMADALMDGGMIGRLHTKARVQEFHADRERLFRDMPVSILIGEDTGSSGEWVAAALQDNDAAVIVGGRTAGSTLVRTFLPIPETNEYFDVATGRFERPKDRLDQNSANDDKSGTGGVIPDVLTDNHTPEVGGNGRIIKRARPASANPSELQGIKPDAALAAAIQELTRRIDVASRETRRN